jgi:cell division septation protein DedD
MDHYSGDSGFQLVIDSRKIIIAGAFLLMVCGTFFVIGFMEGKRQVVRGAAQPETAVQTSEARPAAEPPANNAGAAAKKDDSAVRRNLTWYNDVNKPANETVHLLEADNAPAASGTAAAPKSEPAPAPKPASTPKAAAAEPSKTDKVTYSVQIGAFKERKEAEKKASALKDKKYNSVIEPPSEAGQLFLLKVGRFESRADAVAIQNRLKKDGFVTFIKTNK